MVSGIELLCTYEGHFRYSSDGTPAEEIIIFFFCSLATTLWSCGAGDRADNDRTYLEAALRILCSIEDGDADDDVLEEVAIEDR